MKAYNVFAVSLHHLRRKKTQYVALNYLLHLPTAVNKGTCNRMYLPHCKFSEFYLNISVANKQRMLMVQYVKIIHN